MIEVDDRDILESLIRNNGEVVVDFAAPAWCGPCIKFAPHYKSAASKSDAVFVHVDVDKAPWAMTEYAIQSVPTVKLFRSGEYVQDVKSRTVIALLSEIN